MGLGNADRGAPWLFLVGVVLQGCSPPEEVVETREDDAGEAIVIEEMLTNLSEVSEKLTALAEVFSESEYAWRPAEGVRSGGEVLMHVAAINFAFPLMAGHEAPSSTGLTLDNLPTAAPAYEASARDKASVSKELAGSLDNVRRAISSTSPSDLSLELETFFGTSTIRAYWTAHIAHLHEHLGQLIAYGRMNGVVPPWSG
jgi:hypothetical protein